VVDVDTSADTEEHHVGTSAGFERAEISESLRIEPRSTGLHTRRGKPDRGRAQHRTAAED
jgi:hypothetical protein